MLLQVLALVAALHTGQAGTRKPATQGDEAPQRNPNDDPWTHTYRRGQLQQQQQEQGGTGPEAEESQPHPATSGAAAAASQGTHRHRPAHRRPSSKTSHHSRRNCRQHPLCSPKAATETQQQQTRRRTGQHRTPKHPTHPDAAIRPGHKHHCHATVRGAPHSRDSQPQQQQRTSATGDQPNVLQHTTQEMPCHTANSTHNHDRRPPQTQRSRHRHRQAYTTNSRGEDATFRHTRR